MLVRSVDANSVRFFDPLLGEAEMPRASFGRLWAGTELRLGGAASPNGGVSLAGGIPPTAGVGFTEVSQP